MSKVLGESISIEVTNEINKIISAKFNEIAEKIRNYINYPKVIETSTVFLEILHLVHSKMCSTILLGIVR